MSKVKRIIFLLSILIITKNISAMINKSLEELAKSLAEKISRELIENAMQEQKKQKSKEFCEEIGLKKDGGCTQSLDIYKDNKGKKFLILSSGFTIKIFDLNELILNKSNCKPIKEFEKNSVTNVCVYKDKDKNKNLLFIFDKENKKIKMYDLNTNNFKSPIKYLDFNFSNKGSPESIIFYKNKNKTYYLESFKPFFSDDKTGKILKSLISEDFHSSSAMKAFNLVCKEKFNNPLMVVYTNEDGNFLIECDNEIKDLNVFDLNTDKLVTYVPGKSKKDCNIISLTAYKNLLMELYENKNGKFNVEINVEIYDLSNIKQLKYIKTLKLSIKDILLSKLTVYKDKKDKIFLILNNFNRLVFFDITKEIVGYIKKSNVSKKYFFDNLKITSDNLFDINNFKIDKEIEKSIKKNLKTAYYKLYKSDIKIKFKDYYTEDTYHNDWKVVPYVEPKVNNPKDNKRKRDEDQKVENEQETKKKKTDNNNTNNNLNNISEITKEDENKNKSFWNNYCNIN